MDSFVVRLTSAQLDMIAAALSELPYKHVAPIISEMQRQVAIQIREASEPKTSEG